MKNIENLKNTLNETLLKAGYPPIVKIISTRRVWEFDTETGTTATFWATPTNPHSDKPTE